MKNKKEHVTKLRTTRKLVIDENFTFVKKGCWHRFWAWMHRISALVFLWPFLRMRYGIKVLNRKIAKQLKHKGAVIVSNHIHPLDIQMIATSIFGMRKVYWLTLEQNFNLSVHWMIGNSGGIPIPENQNAKAKFFQETNQLLKDGNILHICPEGSLCDNCEELRPFKDGAFRYSYSNNVPILPVTLQIQYKDERRQRRPRYVIKLNELIYPNTKAEQPIEIQTLKQKVYNSLKNAQTVTFKNKIKSDI